MKFFQSVTKIFSDAGEAISGAATQAGQAVVETSVGVGGVISDAASFTGRAVVGTVTEVGEAVGSATSQAGLTVVQTAVTARETIGSAASQAGQTVVETSIGVGEAIGGATLQATQVAGQAIAIVSNNPHLQQAIKSLNQEWLNCIIEQVDLVKAEAAVRKLQQENPGKPPAQIAHLLMLEKAIYAGGTGLASSLVPGEAAVMFAVDWVATAALSAELVYQIAAAYGLNLKAPERQGEVLAIFGLALGGRTAIKAGLGLLRNVPVAGAVLGASSNAVMSYALGYAACQFYEAKQKRLILEAAIVDTQVESEKYLEAALAQEVIIDQVLVHVIMASNPGKTWSEILPEIEL